MRDFVNLTNLHIWDGSRTVDADTIQMHQGAITFVGARANTPSGGSFQDCAGLTAIPGLIDAHVHLELNPDDKSPPERTLPNVIPLMAERAKSMVAAGITTARDLGGGAWYELVLRNDIADGKLVGPRLLCSGQPITTPQGHCHFWGGGAANQAAALAVLHQQVSKGVDLIKIMATGGRMTRGSQPTATQFSQSTMNALVAAAHAHNLPVAAHCHGTAGIHQAALAGVQTIEHCSWVGQQGWASDYQDSVAQIILDNGVWVSPTVNKGWQRMLERRDGKVLARIRAAYRQMLTMGIPMVASTDAGIPGVYHADLPHALVVFAKIAELSPAQTLISATSNAARALGIEQICGKLAVGLAADILLLDGNPLQDLSNLTRPAQVYCQGYAVL